MSRVTIDCVGIVEIVSIRVEAMKARSGSLRAQCRSMPVIHSARSRSLARQWAIRPVQPVRLSRNSSRVVIRRCCVGLQLRREFP